MRFFCVFGGSGANGGPVCPLGSTLGTILVAFALLGAPFGAPWVPKAVQKSKKERKNEVLHRPGRPEGPKAFQRRPRPSKTDPKSWKNFYNNMKKTYIQQSTLQERIGWIDCRRARLLQKNNGAFNNFLS